VWALFGWATLVLDGGVHGTVAAVGWLAARPWLVGAAGLGWMAALAGLTAYEQLGRHGRAVATAAGVAALALAAVAALHPAWLPPVLAGQGRAAPPGDLTSSSTCRGTA
jgi:hypothetical protein